MTDYRVKFECAAELIHEIICESNRKNEIISHLNVEIERLREQLSEFRYNPYHDPKNGRFTTANGVDFSGGSGIIEVGSDDVALEYQRYGRNKHTLVNKTYIDSGEYRRKFDNATDNLEVNKSLYECAKAALKHRSGTEFEDMYWLDGNTGKILASEINSTDSRKIKYSASTKSAVGSNDNVVTLHTHPSSMPPSIEDFNSCCLNSYKVGYIACHNGKIFGYSSEQLISSKLYELSISEYLNRGLSEFDAQMQTIEALKRNHKIDFWEVK